MFDKKDQAQCINLVKILKKAKYELDGMEVLALSKVFEWVGELSVRIEEDIKREDARLKEEDEKMREQIANAKTSRKTKNGDA